MVFSSVIFLGIFLPLLLILYHFAPSRKVKNYLLLAFSLFFYAWGEPVWIITMVFTAFVDYYNALWMQKLDREGKAHERKKPLIASLIINLGILLIFKYSGFFSLQIYHLIGISLPAWTKPMPVGISFYTFQSLSYIIDVYRRDTKVQTKFSYYLMYVALFPQLVAGPIVRYRDIAYEIEHREESGADFHEGILRFVTGFGKKILLANYAGEVATTLLTPYKTMTTLIPMGNTWLGALFFTFQIYFDFSGYSDMAIGLGKMFGFHYHENFNYPYMARSITDFWRRWHISLSSFFRDYLYIPLGGNRKNQYLNIMIVWALTGLWHGASWNFILWGIYYGVLLIIEKKWLKTYLEKSVILARIYTLFFVLLGWLIFFAAEPGLLSPLVQSFFGVGSKPFALSLIGSTYLIRNIFLLAVFFIASTNLPARVGHTIEKSRLGTFFDTLYILAVFGLSFAVMIGQTYNPFLYFRF